MADLSEPPDGDELPQPVVEDLVADPRRRAVLRCLADRGEPVCLTDLATAVGAVERETAPEAVDTGERRQIRDDIYQHHLPKLTATGVVEFDSMRGTVTLADATVAERVA